MVPYGTCEVEQSNVRRSSVTPKENLVRQNRAQSMRPHSSKQCSDFEGKISSDATELSFLGTSSAQTLQSSGSSVFRALSRATHRINGVFEGSAEQSMAPAHRF